MAYRVGVRSLGVAAVVVMLAAPALASCSSDAAASGCSALVGQPVTRVGMSCSGSSASGSGGCYAAAGARRGDFYWVNYADGGRYLYGRPGGVWKSGTTELDLGEIADRLGC